MQDWCGFAGFFSAVTTPDWRDRAADHAARLGLTRTAGDDISKFEFRGGARARLAVEVTDREWPMFGVFGMTADLFTADRAAETARVLLALADGLRARFARSYFGDSAVPTVNELEQGPDSLDWLQYFGSAITNRFPKPLSGGPFHATYTFDSGGAGIALGVSPFGDLLSRKAAAQYLGITLRPIRAKNPATGAPIELTWP